MIKREPFYINCAALEKLIEENPGGAIGGLGSRELDRAFLPPFDEGSVDLSEPGSMYRALIPIWPVLDRGRYNRVLLGTIYRKYCPDGEDSRE